MASQVLKKQTLRGTELMDNTAAAFQSQLRTSDFHEDAVESSELHFRAVCSVGKPSACHDFFFFFFFTINLLLPQSALWPHLIHIV